MSLAPLPGGNILGGTTVGAGTGGERKAKEAELYILDMETKQVEWHEPIFHGIHSFTDLCLAPSGLCYGIADRKRLFVFDPETRKVIHEEDVGQRFGSTNSQQGPRVFVEGSDRTIYLLFTKGIASIDAESFTVTMLAASPVPIGPGGDFLDGRIYFGSGSHLYSWVR